MGDFFAALFGIFIVLALSAFLMVMGMSAQLNTDKGPSPSSSASRYVRPGR